MYLCFLFIYIRSVKITIENQTKQTNGHKSGKYEL